MYERTIDGGTTTFGVSGKLWQSALIMYDRATESLWSHITGECVKGEHLGKTLTVFPSAQTTWAEWKKAHPETQVLLKDAGMQDGSRYAAYFSDPDRMGIRGGLELDERLPGKDLVLGVRVAGEAAAYPVELLDLTPVLNDRLGGIPVVIAWMRESRSAFVFVRKHNNNELNFEAVRRAGELRMQDDRTGTLWDPARGEAMGGPVAGKQLEPISSTQVFWFAWSSFFPRTRLWSGKSNE